MPLSTHIDLAPESWKVSRSGVEDFYWPVQRDRVAQAAHGIVSTILATVRNLRPEAAADAEDLLIVSSYFARECVCVLAAEMLAQSLRRAQITADLPEAARYWQLAVLGKQPQESRDLNVLRRGVRRPSFIRRSLRPLKDIAPNAVFRSRPIEFLDVKNDIVCTTVCPLTSLRALSENRRPVVTPLYEWFYPMDAAELAGLGELGMTSHSIKWILDAVERDFAACSVDISPASRAWLGAWLLEVSRWVQGYRRRLLENADRLPRRLWAGSGGVIWTRLLAQATLATGGEVVGHDHAEGANYSLASLMPFTELQYCTRFVTFTEEHAGLYRRLGPALLGQETMPEIVATGDAALSPVPRSRKQATGNDEPHVLYVNPLIPLDVISPTPLYPAMAIFDWTARLVTMLQEMGYSVTQKPHPESPVRLSAALTHGLNAPELTGRFEDVFDQYDVIVFDFPMQTSFGTCLRSDKPMVLIDLGIAKYDEGMRRKLAQRCPIVPARIDAGNRIDVDRSLLQAALSEARRLARQPAAMAAAE